MKKTFALQVASLLVALAVGLFFWETFERKEADNFLTSNKGLILDQLLKQEPGSPERQKLLQTVFRSIDVRSPGTLFAKFGIKEFSPDTALLWGRLSSPLTGYRCLEIELDRPEGRWKIKEIRNLKDDSRKNCFADLDLLQAALKDSLSESLTTRNITIESVHSLSVGRLKVQGYLVFESSIHQYSVNLRTESFRWVADRPLITKLPL